ncbi:MAG: lipoyl(octanoyl) transferase [Solirubrobacterales bacterium]|jgi:lipoyl(octanoyl) transferase|nr:lipoyl(octanoyl) transferase [Solirubrobacterales bacterium]
MDEVWIVRPGQVPYADAVGVQKRLEAARHAGDIPDVLLLLEHPPVYTKGRRTDPSELAMGEDWYRMQGIEVSETNRGGRVTYHGPGQLVGYPIADLKAYGDDVHRFVRGIEQTMIEALAAMGVEAQCIKDLTGVWTLGDPPSAAAPSAASSSASRPGAAGVGLEPGGPDQPKKIGSIGIHVNRGITTHGLAINVNNDLQPFEWIVPCGIEGVRMTSVCRELGAEQDLGAAMTAVASAYGEAFERAPVEISPVELAERAGIEPIAAGSVPAA